MAPKGQMLLAMVVFGTIGLVRRNIALDSITLSLLRAALGCGSLLVFILLLRRPVHRAALQKQAGKLLVSGLLLGLDWACFFESFNHTTVAIATLCYYMAPVFMLIAAPLVFHEHLSRWKIGCAAVTIFGMLLVSGAVGSGAAGTGDFTGIFFALLGAVFYAGIIILTKTLTGLDAFEESAVQLGIAALFLLAYSLVRGGMDFSAMTGTSWLLLLLLGVVHTGMAYALYFGSLAFVPAQTAALLSYADPLLAVLLSVFVLREPISPVQGAGVILVLGGMMASEKK